MYVPCLTVGTFLTMIQIDQFRRSVSSRKCTDRHMYISKDQESNLRISISVKVYKLYTFSSLNKYTHPIILSTIENVP